MTLISSKKNAVATVLSVPYGYKQKIKGRLVGKRSSLACKYVAKLEHNPWVDSSG